MSDVNLYILNDEAFSQNLNSRIVTSDLGHVVSDYSLNCEPFKYKQTGFFVLKKLFCQMDHVHICCYNMQQMVENLGVEGGI
jgi:hypothetical protein